MTVAELSPGLKRALIDQFSPTDLRDLAAAMEMETPRMVARRRLSDDSIEELAEMLTTGKWPTIGWWRRAS
jgi:hypothetical protein